MCCPFARNLSEGCFVAQNKRRKPNSARLECQESPGAAAQSGLDSSGLSGSIPGAAKWRSDAAEKEGGGDNTDKLRIKLFIPWHGTSGSWHDNFR